MASIDRTYTDSFKEYTELKDWMEDKVVTFFDGYQAYISNCLYEWEEKDFNGRNIPVMNTPTWLDSYLMNHCPIPFVIERLKYVYGVNFEKIKNLNLSNLPEHYQQNRKIVIVNNKFTQFPLCNKPYNNKKWWLQTNDLDLWYNDLTKKWAKREIYPTNSNTSLHSSIKALIRFLRKQYLPPNYQFELIGGAVGERYTVIVK